MELRRAGRRLARIADRRSSHERLHLAPRLSSRGQQLVWSDPAGAEAFIVEAVVSGDEPQFTFVRGTAFTPPPVAGATVFYRVRATGGGGRWSSKVAITYPPPPQPAANPRTAPLLTAAAQLLTWTAVEGASSYILWEEVGSAASTYTVITATSYQPPQRPGLTVTYRVRTDVEGSSWSAPVQITYPDPQTSTTTVSTTTETVARTSSTVASTTETTTAMTTTKTTAASTQTATSQPLPSGFEPGLNDNGDPEMDIAGALKLGARVVRVGFSYRHPASEAEHLIGQYAAAGLRVLPLILFDGTMPSSEQARAVGEWAALYGPGGSFWSGKSYPAKVAITEIEFGNETSYEYQYADNSPEAIAERAQLYAIRFKEAAEAIRAVNPHVVLLAQGDAGNDGPAWLSNMFKAVPNLATYVGGWTIHPYTTNWRQRLEQLVSETAQHGAPATIPIDITEWGLSTDNGKCVTENYGWNPCMTYAEAAATLKQTVSEMRALLGSRLHLFILFQIFDQEPAGSSENREGYFGALQNNLEPKGAYTEAVSQLMAE